MTTLVGLNTTAGNGGMLGRSTVPILSGSLFVASATGSATSMSMQCYSAETLALCIYSAANELLGYTNSFTTPASGVATASLLSAVSIVNGTSYLLGILYDGTYPIYYTDGSASTIYLQYPAGTWPTPPSTFAANDSENNGLLSVWASSGGSGVVPSRMFMGSVLPLAPLAWIIERRNRVAREERGWRQEKRSRLWVPNGREAA